MQQVERKTHGSGRGKRTRWLLLCCGLLLISIGVGLLLMRQAEEKPAEIIRKNSGAITRREAEELESVTVAQRGKEAWTLIRDENGALRLLNGEEAGSWAVDDSLGSAIVDTAVNLTYEDVLTEDPAAWQGAQGDFGLDSPLVTAAFRFTDGETVRIRIGDPVDQEEKDTYYMAVEGDGRLFAVGAGITEDLNTEKELLHPVNRLTIHGALLDRMTVRNGDGSVRVEWTLQGRPSDQDAAENWLITAPFVYPADYDAVKNLREMAEKLTPGVYIGAPDEETLKRCGLEEPTAILEFHMAAGSTGTVSDAGVYDVTDWEERTETLTIGGSRSEMVAYVLRGDEICTFNWFFLRSFTETDPFLTAARYLVATPLNSLESATVEREGEEAVHYGLVRTEDPAAGAEEEETAGFRCLKNGEEISAAAFEAAWERLLTVTVSGRLPEQYTPGEAHTKYTFRTVSGGTHTISLSDYDGVHDAVMLDGHALFYMIKGGMTELP